MKKIISLSIFILYLTIHSQGTGFSNVEIIPLSTTINDSIKVCYKYTAVSWPAIIHSHQVTISETNVYLNICFGKGQRDLISVFYDTVNIGVYPVVGNYHVTLYMNITSLDDTLCYNSMWYDSAETSFTITGPTGLSFYKRKRYFFILPQPHQR
jgi:hypothetical protein